MLPRRSRHPSNMTKAARSNSAQHANNTNTKSPQTRCANCHPACASRSAPEWHKKSRSHPPKTRPRDPDGLSPSRGPVPRARNRTNPTTRYGYEQRPAVLKRRGINVAMASGSQAPLSEPLLDAGAAAHLLGVRPSWIYEAVRDGRLPHIKVGRHIRFLRSDLEEWVLRRRVGGRCT